MGQTTIDMFPSDRPATRAPLQCNRNEENRAATAACPDPTMAPTALETEEQPMVLRTKLQLSASVIAIYLSTFLFALDATIIATCLPTISHDLAANSSFSWVGSVYWLASAAAGPLWSNWSNIWGRKPMMLTCIALFFFSSIICAQSKDIAMLIAGRVFQGLGGGGINLLVYILISDLFSMRMRTMIIGLMEVVWATAAGTGPVLGGVITQRLSWRWVFWINLPVAGLAFALILFFLHVHNPRTPAKDGLRAIDWFGGLSITGLTVMLLLGLNFGGEAFPWGSPTVICLIVFGVLMFALFVFSEKRLAQYPIVPLGIFSDKSNVAGLIGTAAQAMVVGLSEFYLPLYFQSVRNASPTTSGVLLIPFDMAEAITAFVVGIVMNRTGRYVEIIWASTLLMTIGSGLFIDLTEAASLAKVIAYQIVAGIGTGGLFQPYIIAVQARVPQRDQAAATAALGFTRGVATAFAQVVGGVIFQNGMLQRGPGLIASGLSPSLVAAFSGGDAVASVVRISSLENPVQRQAVETAYARSMQIMWVFMTVAAAVGFGNTTFVRKAVLSTEHVETKTGLRKQASPESGRQAA